MHHANPMLQQQRWSNIADFASYLARQQEWMPLRDAARLYRVTPETMHTWAKQQRFCSQRFGEALWISRSELEAALCSQPVDHMR